MGSIGSHVTNLAALLLARGIPLGGRGETSVTNVLRKIETIAPQGPGASVFWRYRTLLVNALRKMRREKRLRWARLSARKGQPFFLLVDICDCLGDLYFRRSYEAASTRLLVEELRPGDTFLDVGANCGYYSMLASVLVGQGGHVFAFEPIPFLVESIELSTQKNRAQNVLTTVPAAVSSRVEESVSFHIPSHATAIACLGDSLGDIANSVQIQVPVITLDSWIEETGVAQVDVIKIDVEGAEGDVLKGAKKCISNYRPRLLLIETDSENLKQVETIVCELGYSMVEIETIDDDVKNYKCTLVKSA